MQQSIKQEAIKAISSLPESATIEDIMYRLYVIDKVHEGFDDVRNGRVITSEELEKEIQSW
jgi:predicted transcriptional regulator